MVKKVKGEKFMFALMIFFFSLTFILNIVNSSKVQSNNAEVQRLESQIKDQEKINLSMQMKINELASLDNALDVASAYGLEYNNKNIRVIQE